MTTRLIRVSSRALGHRARVQVYVYDTVEEMRAAATRFAPNGDFSHAVGVTQSYRRERVEKGGKTTVIAAPFVIRLVVGHLAPFVIVHEIVHAASHIYGDTLEPDALADDLLNVDNEPFAHLVSDLYLALTKRLWATGLWSDD